MAATVRRRHEIAHQRRRRTHDLCGVLTIGNRPARSTRGCIAAAASTWDAAEQSLLSAERGREVCDDRVTPVARSGQRARVAYVGVDEPRPRAWQTNAFTICVVSHVAAALATIRTPTRCSRLPLLCQVRFAICGFFSGCMA
jgi:hypothetical protein